jgi:thioredoxin reductase
MEHLMIDALVIGGGPAGLQAGLTLGRMHREAVVVDSGAYRNAAAERMHNALGHDGTPPAELRESAHKELAAYPSVELREGTVMSVAKHPRGFRAVLADGSELQSRRVLLATGVSDELPALPGMAELWGRSVLHCPYCHGFESTGSAIAVQGSEPGRVRLALMLSRFTEDVVLCTDGGCLDDASLSLLDRAGVEVRREAITALRHDGSRLTAIAFQDAPELARDFLFAHPAVVARSPLAEGLGCGLLGDGSVAVDDLGRTSTSGVYAAGDHARRASLPMAVASVVAAMAAGQLAAASLDQELLSEDFGLPHPL